MFLELHGTMGPQLYRYFAPVTVISTVLPAVTAGLCFWHETSTRFYSAVSAAIMLSILGIYFLYFKAANESFKTGSVGIDGLPAELQRWAAWHGLRTVLSLLAFLTSLIALT